MGDVQLATAASRISKTTGLLLGRGSHGNEPPAFTLPPRNARVNLGGTARLDGKVRGYPDPLVTWYREGEAVIGGERCVMEQSGRGTFSLVVRGVREEDFGRYTCQAANDAGSRQVTVEIILEENSGKKYGLPSSVKTGGHLVVPAVETRPSIWGESPPKFITKPSRVYSRVGQTAKLSAKTTGRPQPLVTWLKGEVELHSCGRFSMYERSGLHFLEIQEVCLEDAGSYMCTVTNSAGTTTATAELSVQDSPSDSTSPRPSAPSSSKPANPAEVTGTSNGLPLEPGAPTAPRAPTAPSTRPHQPNPPLGKDSPQVQPRPEASWRTSGGVARSKPPVDLPVGAERKVPSPRTAGPHSQVQLVKGQSVCGTGTVQTSPEPSVERDQPPEPQQPRTNTENYRRPGREARVAGSNLQFEAHPLDQEVTEGSKVTFTCQVSSRAVSMVTWLKEGSAVRPRPGVQQHQGGGRLTLCLEAVQRTDGGTYGCSVTTPTRLTLTSPPWTLTVHSGASQVEAPVFSRVLRGCTLSEGHHFTLQAAVEARPPPSISWLLNGSRVSAGACSSYEGGVARLTVQNALQRDGGVYVCVAENSQGRAECSAKVEVRGRGVTGRSEVSQARGQGEVPKTSAPSFISRLTDLSIMDGSQVTMTVQVTGHPAPEVVWLHNGQQVTESEDFLFHRKDNLYTLLIQEVFPEDTGIYTCLIRNQYGEDHSQARLTVQEPRDGVQPWFITKPKPVCACLGQHVLLSCAIAGDPFPQYTWSRTGHSQPLPLVSGGDYQLLQKEDVVSLLIRRVKKHHAGDYLINLRNKVGECSCVARLSVSDGQMDTTRGGGEESSSSPKGGRGGGGERGGTVVLGGGVRGGGVEESSSSCSTSRLPLSSQQWQEAREDTQRRAADPRPQLHSPPHNQERLPAPQQQKEAQVRCGPQQGLLKRGVETRECREEEVRQREAQQLDFRSLLGRRVVSTRTSPEEDLREDAPMDSKPNLKGERKGSTPQQVDFRAVLGKKGGPGNGTKSAEPTKNPVTSSDFRSVLSNKKKQNVPEKNRESGEKEDKLVVNNCVDGGIKEKRSGGGGGKGLEFVEKLCDVTVVDGQRLRLQCRLVTSDPSDVTVTWTLDGKVIKPSKFIVLANEGGLCSLTIDKALPEDEGQYKCGAECPAGQAECSCMVLVDDPIENSTAEKKCKKSTPTSESEARIKKPTPKTPPKQALPPQILQFPEDMKILAGEKVEILCRFSGAPPINCTWLKFRKPIQAGIGDVTIDNSDSSSKLTIAAGQQEHCGCYTIELRNTYGLRQAALNLTIVDKPDPPAKVPAASDIRRSTLTLSWYGPTYDGGSAVQSYNLEVWDSVEQQWKDLVSCNSTSYNVQNLLPERQYKFRVRAVNIYGVGEPSAESEPVIVGLAEDDDSEKDPDYRDVMVRTDVKVKELYDVEERLGTGKFGQVFKLVEKSTKKVWAGKFIKAYSTKEKENVRQEIGIMNSLHHPKLVQCIDAFEGKSDIVMVLEMISGGELFERIIDEDFELTEREVIKYMLQIVDGVSFIHKQGIVHLDLKPENIMCVNKTGSKIKLIDFGLARRLENAGTLKVLFGTPEFVAPEVINYEAISYPTDMWSIGVICYILVSGLSPFMGDNDNETLSNVTSATWDFEDEAFDEISDNAKAFITNLLKKDMRARLTCAQCFEHPWLKQDTNTMKAKKLSKERMKKYILRRKWQKTGHAVRAIGRLSSMAMLAGVSAKKGSPTEEDNQFLECLEYEQKTESKPSFSSVIRDVEVVEGSAARFDCKIEGYPDPEVVWYKDEQPIKETRHFQIDYDEDGNCSLVISEVSGDDDAKYTVKAVNSLGEATCTAELLVEVMAGEEEEEEEEEEE
ncbi:myosin light chain kinase, smooth muscle [Polymixia lowei]